MDRRKFLKFLQEFDNNYTTYQGSLRDTVIEEAKEKNITVKETFKDSKNLSLFSQINYSKIHNLTNTNNLFSPFYNIEYSKLEVFFKALHTTEYLLINKERLTNLRTYRERQSLIKKYQAVIADMESINSNNLEWLRNRQNELTKETTLTERKIFENLLFIVFKTLRGSQEQLTVKIVNTVNEIITHYFNVKDISFTHKVDLNRLNKKIYRYYRTSSGNTRLIKNVEHEFIIFHS